jgi:hypothetical protein
MGLAEEGLFEFGDLLSCVFLESRHKGRNVRVHDVVFDITGQTWAGIHGNMFRNATRVSTRNPRIILLQNIHYQFQDGPRNQSAWIIWEIVPKSTSRQDHDRRYDRSIDEDDVIYFY